MNTGWNTLMETAARLDATDPLAGYKKAFHFPKKDGENVVYFCGNSLGLQPRNTEAAIQQEMNDWKDLAINGFYQAKNPWLFYQDYFKTSLSRIVGAMENEVTVMNTLTVNLHLLLLTFYQPTAQRYKILMEAGAFPSDQYAIETQVQLRGVAGDAIIELEPRPGEKTLRNEDILDTIRQHGNSLALVLLGGIQYYTGQLFDMAAITQAAHAAGAIAGFDLAHAVGNVPLQLHNWEVDFAVWCSYKYLNGGPGAVGGAYVHERFATNTSTPRLAGWWGNEENIRFKMEKGFIPKATAAGWNISTAQVFNMVGLKASLEWFDQAGMENIRTKSIALTGYLQFLLQQLTNIQFEIITPTNPEDRGAQLSLFFKQNGKEIHTKMVENGIVVDYREPGVIRVAPAPLYCSFADVYRFYQIIRDHF